MQSPLLLDLFAGPGGAGAGYALAGYHIIGCDIAPQPRNPHICYQDDALSVLDTLLEGKQWQGYRLRDFQAIHASPPCQEYSKSRFLRDANFPHAHKHEKLIQSVPNRLDQLSMPWVIENVVGSPLPDAIELCGSMFGLPIRRHRWFSSAYLLFAPGPCQHTDGFYNPVGGKIRGYGTLASKTTYQDSKGATRKREGYYRLATGQAAMGIDWMGLKELSQAIPPAYTAWLGKQLLQVVACEVAA